jgi:AcrR family transcriptional regulator
MTEPALDHRRATAQRNAASILDAAERLLARRTPLSMVAIAAEAGVSRPTLYAHYRSIAEIVEAAVERSVVGSLAAFQEARPEDGPADQALLRMAEASWRQLERYEALARGAAEHLPAGAAHRSHGAMLAPLQALIDRGRREGAFRTDLPADWLVSLYFALVRGPRHRPRAGPRAAEDQPDRPVHRRPDVTAPRARRSRAVAAWPLMRLNICTGRSPSSTRSARRSVLASALSGEPEANGGWGRTR